MPRNFALWSRSTPVGGGNVPIHCLPATNNAQTRRREAEWVCYEMSVAGGRLSLLVSRVGLVLCRCAAAPPSFRAVGCNRGTKLPAAGATVIQSRALSDTQHVSKGSLRETGRLTGRQYTVSWTAHFCPFPFKSVLLSQLRAISLSQEESSVDQGPFRWTGGVISSVNANSLRWAYSPSVQPVESDHTYIYIHVYGGRIYIYIYICLYTCTYVYHRHVYMYVYGRDDLPAGHVRGIRYCPGRRTEGTLCRVGQQIHTPNFDIYNSKI